MKSKQFCSVCKQWLDMEIVPTGDGEDDDGVVWFRCPQCQGFLPKLSSQLEEVPADDSADPTPDPAPAAETSPPETTETPDDMPWDSPADMMAARRPEAESDEREAEPAWKLPADRESPTAQEETAPAKKSEAPAEPAEPLAEYAALLAEKDPSGAVPYRPWEVYEVGQCVHHLAWDDCGVVVAKEDLPGGRKIIKCYFAEAGVVRLIEKAPR